MANVIVDTDKGFIVMIGRGHYQVFKHGTTAAAKVATYHFSDRPEYAYQRASEKLHSL